MKSVYPHIIPDIENWPIYKIHQRRKKYVDELNANVKKQLLNNSHVSILELIEKTLYAEQRRVRYSPWRSDPNDDKIYWKNLQKEIELAKKSADPQFSINNIFDRIINRYNEEIVGNFKISTFKFARKFLTAFFKKLLNPFKTNGQSFFWGKRKNVQNKIKVTGFIDQLRTLCQKGVVIIVPTHSSNLDSAIIGYSLDAVIGVSAFSYGAGLNLFNNELVAYMINRLGAYKVDRRKKNPIYLECLKSMASYSIQLGLNQIFFPGGTRSRSGHIEQRLKLGLLGSVVEAQRILLMNDSSLKVFVVPLILNYHYVLEAKPLIEQFLRSQSKEKYIKTKDQFKSFYRTIQFMKSIFSSKGELVLSIGKSLDVFGNEVDTNGNSIDKKGNTIDIKGYFQIEDDLNTDEQREKVYTKILGERILTSYKNNIVVLTSNVISHLAFAIFNNISNANSTIEMLNTPPSSYSIPYDFFIAKIRLFKQELQKAKKQKTILLSQEINQSETQILINGLTYLGQYHSKKVLYLDKEKNIKTEDLKLLFFYSNRLDGYNFLIDQNLTNDSNHHSKS